MSTTAALQIDTFLPYMRDVQRCDQALRELNLTWRLLESDARISCAEEGHDILPMIAATRQGFERLEQGLVGSLVAESVATVMQTVGIKARQVVDIVVRNLYERTADVGFLATDRDLCDFLAQGDGGDVDRARARLAAYRSKYTVYEDILLLAPDGSVRARIGDGDLAHSADPLVAQTLAADGYVETFRASDLRPGRAHALVYSRRMLGADGRVVGLLCLVFDFEREMGGIFRSRSGAEERAVMLLLDGDNRVVASADGLWIPPGTVVPVNHDHAARLVVFSGREYLVRTWRPQGYQGYPGPAGWQGQVMIPVDIAFTAARTGALAGQPVERVQGLLTHAQRFCPPLWEIVTAAQAIHRVVWNGQVVTARRGDGGGSATPDGRRGGQGRLKALLSQVSETGARTNALFSQSIRDLYDTVLGAQMRRGEFVTRLQVDLLDRNLYERADDCRWWALTPELRQALAGGERAPDMAAVATILQEINALYTVYTRLVVYDRQGRIVATSAPHHDDGQPVVGGSIESDTLGAVLSLPSPQHYHVTPFRPCALYEGRATYVFHAAIRAPEQDNTVVGGIGIVFDAEPEFRAMLRDALDGRDADGQAYFIDRQGQVIASLDDRVPVCTRLDGLDTGLLAQPAGSATARIVEHRGRYAVLSVAAGCGYREFKVSDGYRQDVLAVVFDPLGEVVQAEARGDDDARVAASARQGEAFATVYVGGQLHALPAARVLEAIPGASIVPVSAGRLPHRLGAVQLRHQGADGRTCWVFDLPGLVHGTPSARPETQQVVVVQIGQVMLGLLVGRLHGVPEFAPSQIVPRPLAGLGRLIGRLIRGADQGLLIPVLDLAEVARACGCDPGEEADDMPDHAAGSLPDLAAGVLSGDVLRSQAAVAGHLGG